jgi:2-amino-4-hydroxy-6-hydroxymethyldihydropteridine diphosphokinase
MTINRYAYIGLGSNLDDRVALLRHAVRYVRRLSPWCRCSTLYESHPLGTTRQPNFLNAVMEIRWRGTASSLLTALHAVERRLGRRRLLRWGPRTVDLDLLLLGTQVSRDRSLTLPHASIDRRPFVLSPLLELAPQVRSPATGRRYARYRCLLPASGMWRRRANTIDAKNEG